MLKKLIVLVDLFDDRQLFDLLKLQCGVFGLKLIILNGIVVFGFMLFVQLELLLICVLISGLMNCVNCMLVCVGVGVDGWFGCVGCFGCFGCDGFDVDGLFVLLLLVVDVLFMLLLLYVVSVVYVSVVMIKSCGFFIFVQYY